MRISFPYIPDRSIRAPIGYTFIMDSDTSTILDMVHDNSGLDDIQLNAWWANMFAKHGENIYCNDHLLVVKGIN